MNLDRGTLASLDRKLLAGLGQEKTYRMVRVPVTAAKWAAWKRYCDAAGASKGRTISVVIEGELAAAVAGSGEDPVPVLGGEAEARLEACEEEVARRERDVEAAKARLQTSEIDLRHRERQRAGRWVICAP